MKKTFLTLAAAALAVSAQAQLLIDEPFDYSNGNLTTVSGGSWVNYSGTGTFIPVTDGAITLSQGSGSREDVERSLGVTMGTGDTFYYAMDLSVSGGSSATYFAMLWQSSSLFAGRLFVTAPSGAGDFTFGVSSTSSSVEASWGSDLSFNTIYKVVVAYSYDSALTTLWVNPVDASSTSVTTPTAGASDAVVAMAFRQAAGDSVETIYDLKVGTTFASVVPVPEPHEYAIAMAGFLMAVVVMRRRRASRA